MSQGFIYKWTNNINGMMYIGKHLGSTEDNYKGSGQRFLRAFNKYGEDKFTREILEVVDDSSKLNNREQHYLDLYECAKSDMYYNISPVAGGGNLGHDYSKSSAKAAQTMKENGTYKRNSQRMKENNPSKNGVWNKGTNINSRGTPIADWEKKAASEMMKKNNPNAGGDVNKKSTYVTSIDSTEKFEFKSLKEAEDFMTAHTGKIINHASVWRNMKIDRPYKGYLWSYTI